MGGPLHQDGQKQRRVNFPFFVALYKEQLEPTWETFFSLIVLNNLWEVFGCSVITHFISTMFELSKVFG